MIDLRELLEEIAPTPERPVRVETVRRRAVQLRRRRRAAVSTTVAALLLVGVAGVVSLREPEHRVPVITTAIVGEWRGQEGDVAAVLSADPAVVTAGDTVTFHVRVTDAHHALDRVALDFGNGETDSLTDVCGAGASGDGTDWSGTATFRYNEPGAYRVGLDVDTFSNCKEGVAGSRVHIDGLVVVRPAAGADPTTVRIIGPDAEVGSPTRLSIQVADTDGGVVRWIIVDWGDGPSEPLAIGCADQRFEPYGTLWASTIPHQYETAGDHPVHVTVTTGPACGINAVEQTVTADATATIHPRSGG